MSHRRKRLRLEPASVMTCKLTSTVCNLRESIIRETNNMSSVPLQIAETIQTAHINRAPDVAHDLSPSTAASCKQPVTVSHHVPSSDSSHELDLYDEAGIDEDEGTEDIPYDVIRPLPRKLSMPPLPDLRFEQSYLASIAGADTKSRIAYITIRDQVCLDIAAAMVFQVYKVSANRHEFSRFCSHLFRVCYGPWQQ